VLDCLRWRNFLKWLFCTLLDIAHQAALASICPGPSWGGGASVSPTILDVGQSAIFNVGLDGPRGVCAGFAFNSSGTVDFDFGDGQTLHIDVPPGNPNLPGNTYTNQVPHVYDFAGSFLATVVLVGMTTWILPGANGGFTAEPVSQTFTDTFTILVGIPEPGSYAMLLVGLTFLAAIAWRRNKNGRRPASFDAA